MSSLHPLELTGSILDPLHGLVRLTEEENQIIDHPLFQRMRSIRQNGLLHLVFPGAIHTRFIHSIGALQVADKILQSLCDNVVTDLKAGKIVAEAPASGQAVALPRGQELKDIFRVARIALLVHDLGHGPTSHGFDPFAPRVRQIQELLRGEPALAALRGLERELCVYGQRGDEPELDGPIAHESMSCVLFAKICADAGLSPGLVTAVAAALIGVDVELTRELKGLRPWIPLIQGIASSSPIDADRMDYMERDSRACGVTYGIFDVNRILKLSLCYRDKDRRYRLGWRYSGLGAIENFVQARFQLYAQVYYHKTSRAFSLMLAQIGRHAKAAGLSLFYRHDGLSAICDRYLELSDDSRFIELLCGADHEEFGRPTGVGERERICALALRIKRRQPWKRIFESSPGWPANAARSALEATKLSAEVYHDRRSLEATKGLERGACLLERVGGIYTAAVDDRSVKTWIDASAILRALHADECSIDRLYYTGEHTGAHEHDTLTRIKDVLRGAIRPSGA